MHTVERYNLTARTLHWLVAAGIVLQVVLGERAEHAAEANALQDQLIALAWHKSIGITVLLLALLRLGWRWVQTPPPLPLDWSVNHAAQARLARIMHWALYALLLVVPLTGWLMSSAKAYSVSWFNLWTLPDLIAANKQLANALQTLHTVAAQALVVLAIGHLGAALKHALVDRDTLLKRMLTPGGLGLFAIGIASGLWLTAGAPAAATVQTRTEAVVAEPALTPAAPLAQDPIQNATVKNQPAPWTIDYANSHIRFSAVQAGAEFRGEWQQFEAMIHFDAAAPEASSAVVHIDATRVSTLDAERDNTLAGPDWFHSSTFSRITFTAETITRLDSSPGSSLENSATPAQFTTNAQLRIRDRDYPVRFDFSVATSDTGLTLSGRSRLDRLALGLGLIEWPDTEWIGQFVDVDVLITAR